MPSYNQGVRRKQDALVPLELRILGVGLDLAARGENEFHGFLVAKHLEGEGERGSLIGHGTLYKALARLEERRLLESRWEDPAAALEQRRPPRRLYRVTGEGQRAYAAAPREAPRAVSWVARGALA
jgi:DNA-binding PadR family transcriptional regulator